MDQWHPLGRVCGVCVHWTVYRVFPFACFCALWQQCGGTAMNGIFPPFVLTVLFLWRNGTRPAIPAHGIKTTTKSIPSRVNTFPVSSHHLAVSQPGRLTDR